MKINCTIQDNKVCKIHYSLHTNAPILKEVEEWAECILDTNYLKVNINKMVDELDIDKDLKGKLKKTLNKFQTLFGGGLGKLSEDFPKASIQLKEGVKPHTATYHTLWRTYREPAKKEIDWMVAVGILGKLKWHNNTSWAAASFCQAKKMGILRIVTDFQKMNKSMERHPFPIPKVLDTMHTLDKFESAMALDLSQRFYAVPLDN